MWNASFQARQNRSLAGKWTLKFPTLMFFFYFSFPKIIAAFVWVICQVLTPCIICVEEPLSWCFCCCMRRFFLLVLINPQPLLAVIRSISRAVVLLPYQVEQSSDFIYLASDHEAIMPRTYLCGGVTAVARKLFNAFYHFSIHRYQTIWHKWAWGGGGAEQLQQQIQRQ